MGYYSSFEIQSVKEGKLSDITFGLELISSYQWSGGNIWEAKWYDFRKDLETFAAQNPHLSFEVERIGEEAPDFELAVVENGTVTFKSGKIVYE